MLTTASMTLSETSAIASGPRAAAGWPEDRDRKHGRKERNCLDAENRARGVDTAEHSIFLLGQGRPYLGPQRCARVSLSENPPRSGRSCREQLFYTWP